MEFGYELNGRPFWVRQWQHQGLSLDPQRNQPDFYNSLNQNQGLLDSRDVAEDEEDNQGFRLGFHGFHQIKQNQENPSPGRRVFHGGLGLAAAGAQPPVPLQKKRSYLPAFGEEGYATGKMGESYQYQHQELHAPVTGPSRLGLRNAGGEIVEVQGGHIVRSTGRKDRHSKVCTAKGPRDRRVRLAAHTAIQFYDVQDRLGYDRPSKAVDWLIKKAKSAIDELAELPAWKPTATSATAPNSTSILNFERNPDRENPNHHQLNHLGQHPDDGMIDNQMGNTPSSSFLPPSLDSDAIADTIKSFFPMGASSTPPGNNSPAMQFHRSFPPPDLISSGNQSQDLRLSLQSFKDPILHHHHHQTEQGNSMFVDGSGWPENQPQRMVAWGGGGGGDVVPAGFMFTSPPLFGQTTNNQLFNNNYQRGPLQSSNTPSIRAWIDQPLFAGAAIDQQQALAFHHPSSMPGFTSSMSGFSGFLIPARIQGEQEEHDGISDKPSSASSDSRH